MKPRRFLISTLLMAGFLPPHTASAIPADPTFDRPSNKSTLFDIFKRDHIFDLSRHSSHRSHSSHSSHSSHRSSNGGGYSAPVYTPPRVYTPPTLYTAPTPQPAPTTRTVPVTPAPATTVLPGTADKFKNIVRQVQTALYVYGYYTGSIDGLVGPQTKIAISTMQEQYGLPVTGTITPDVLDALQVTAE